ncbi:Lectin protein kinase [Heracleum sosnowskyi]|uniref:Lectin protein kinase n=1 Tax=Heracleum sosnowskyi TaxID=360622 RepID=A0AAD8J3M3_9APIA|nr:Lectin protein kinase [Heracleum sosnowskyi]
MILFSSTPPLIFFFIVLLPLLVCSQDNVSFNFPSFTSLRNLTLLGDSYLRDGVIGLTKQLGVPSSSSGTIIYNHPIQFSNQDSNHTASFSTCFSFSINNLNPGSFGDGLAFFISPDNQTLGSPGGYLGLVNSTQFTKKKFVAIEFDTRQDLHFNDPDENHVGLDIDSLTSIKTAHVITIGIDLKSGNLITAWIDYEHVQNILRVYLSYSSSKPVEPVLVVDIDLSEYLREFKYVGFSASTEGSTEIHLLQSWSFSTFGLRPRFPPHNVSDNSVIVSPPKIPVSGKDSKHHKRIGWGLGIAGPAFFCVFLGLFGYISVKKWKGMRMDKSLMAELVTGPRQFSYKQLKVATKGFHASRIVGHGAFGTVYKAFFMSLGTMSAVKRSKHSHEGKTEFLAELSIIACLRHKNLVQLQGCYGVVILELACGRRPIDKEIEGQRMVNLVDWVWGLHSQGRLVEAVDRRLNGELNVEEAKMLLLVGLSCANPDSCERPTMRRVFQILNGEAEPMLVPKMKPTLSFSNHLLLSLEDIVSDCEESQTPERMLEINVE